MFEEEEVEVDFSICCLCGSFSIVELVMVCLGGDLILIIGVMWVERVCY